MDLNQLQHLLRAKDIFSVRECEYALLESNGTLSVLKKPMFENVQRADLNIQPDHVSLPLSLIVDGEIVYDNLKIVHQQEDWLLNEITKYGFQSHKDVLYAEWKEGESLLVQGY